MTTRPHSVRYLAITGMYLCWDQPASRTVPKRFNKECFANTVHQFLVVERFLNEIVHPFLHCGDSHWIASVGGSRE